MNILNAPHPRSRIYTSPNSYWSFLRDLLLGRIKKGDEVGKIEKVIAYELEPLLPFGPGDMVIDFSRNNKRMVGVG